MQKPLLDILLEEIDDDESLLKSLDVTMPKGWREKLTLLRDAEDVQLNAPLWELYAMVVDEKIDAARVRELFPKADERDILMLVAHPTDKNALGEVASTYREPTFAESLSHLSEQDGIVGDHYTVKVTATTDKGKTVSESMDNNLVGFAFVNSTKKIAVHLYEKILAKHPNITESKAAVIMRGPSFETLLAQRLGETS